MPMTQRLTRWLLLGAAFAAPTFAVAAPDGRVLYREHCSACHQTEGRGGIGLPLSRVVLASVSDDYLLKTVRLGRPGRIMPAFEALSDAQVAAIVAYIRGWYDVPAPSFDPAPIAGDPPRGEAVYAEACASCHGADGSGEGPGTGVTLSREREFMIMPPALNNPGFLRAAPDALIRHTVVNGRDGTEMPAFGRRLSAADIDDVVAYVRSFAATPAQAATADAEAVEPSRVVDSPYDFDTTLANVRQALTGANFRLFPDRFLEEGLVDEFSHNQRQVTLRFCNFEKLYNMLNIEPRLGVVLPCRVTVMERADGSVLLVAPNMTTITRWFNNDELKALGATMDDIVVGVLEEATL
ncbi:MAG: c-type cytochrome [Gammaproteobacteria bacterium]